MKILGYFHRLIHPIHRKIPASVRFLNHSYNLRVPQPMSTFSEDPELKEFMDFIDNRNNYGKAGVPKGAGTDSDDGFDLGRMRRLMQLLGNPQCKFKNRLFTLLGQREKGSTVPFLSSILRAQDYSVGCYTSPHIGTIRERITLGVSGAPLPTKTLINHFQSLKMVLERAIELENGCLSHFEVGNSFHILSRFFVIKHPLFPLPWSASDTGNRSIIKSLERMSGRPCQYCDLVLQIEKDLQLFIELCNVKSSMIGHHQLKNAAIATCAALCLRDQGWKLSNESICAGLDGAFLLGKNQILTQNEAERLELSGASILLDGDWLDILRLSFWLKLALREKNLEQHQHALEEVLGSKHLEREIDIHDYSLNENEVVEDPNHNHTEISESRPILFTEGSLMSSIKAGGQILGAGSGGQNGVIVVTGSLYILSTLLGFVRG